MKNVAEDEKCIDGHHVFPQKNGNLKMEHYYALCSTLLQDIINNMHFALVKIFMFIQSKMQSKVH